MHVSARFALLTRASVQYWYFTTPGNYNSSDGDYYRLRSEEDNPPIATPFEAQKCPAGVLPPPQIYPVDAAVRLPRDP